MTKSVVGILKRNRLSIDPEMRIYKDILDFNNIDTILLDINQRDFWEKLKSINLLIYKWGHDHHNFQIATTILPVIECKFGLRCFPDQATCWHYDDKIKQYYLLRENGYPTVDSFIFWSKDSALEWLESRTEFPLVHKLKNGSGSMTVSLVADRKSAKRIIYRMFGKGVLQNEVPSHHVLKTLNYDIEKIFRYYAVKFRNRYINPEREVFWLRHKNYVYFQKFLDNNQWDTRVTTAGDRVHAFRRFTRPGDFRASGSNQWDIDPVNIDTRMLKIALEISREMKFQAMAYDFIYDIGDDPKIVEMSYLYGGAGYPDFMNGYWDKDLKWHEGRFWPQYFELVDLLNMPELRMPEIDTDTSYKRAKLL